MIDPHRPHQLLILTEPDTRSRFVPFCSCGWLYRTAFLGMARRAARDHHADKRSGGLRSVRRVYLLVIEESP